MSTRLPQSAAPPGTAGSGSAAFPKAEPSLAGVLGILLVASSLRPAITSVGPVLDAVGRDNGLDNTMLGLLGTLPLLAFAVVSPLVHGVSRRLGAERVVLLALGGLLAGLVVRSLPGAGGLWLGTAAVGTAIAVCNVLVPSIVKRDHGSRVAVMTGTYSAVMSGFAALASGLAVPLAAVLPGGWRTSLAVWALPALVAALVWRQERSCAAPATEPQFRGARETAVTPPVWRSAVAWQVSVFMGLQATTFYLLISWLPTMEADHGVGFDSAGWHLSFLQLAGIAAGLAVTKVMGRGADQRLTGVVITVPLLVAVTGMMLVPGPAVLWVVLAGVSGGGAMVVALSLIGLRTRTSAQTAQLSGMAQCVGYLMAAVGPVAAGLLHDGTGSWTAVYVVMAVLALAQIVVALYAGRQQYTH